MSPFSRGRPEGSLFNSNYTEVWGRALLLSQDCSTLPLIRTLYCWVLSKEVSSTIFKVFGMTWPGIESRSPGPLANIQPTRPMRMILFIVKLLLNVKCFRFYIEPSSGLFISDAVYPELYSMLFFKMKRKD